MKRKASSLVRSCGRDRPSFEPLSLIPVARVERASAQVVLAPDPLFAVGVVPRDELPLAAVHRDDRALHTRGIL